MSINTEDIIELASEYETLEDLLEVVPQLQKMPVVEVGQFLQKIEEQDLISILDQFTSSQQGLIFSEFSDAKQLAVFNSTSKKRFSIIFENMPSDYRADLFQNLTHLEQVALLPFLSKSVREDVITLSSYPPETAGGIMSTDFATVQKSMTCADAIKKVRSDAPSKKTIYYVYVVDEDQTMQGFVTLKDLILAQPTTSVADTLHDDFVCAYVDDDREKVAMMIEKYDLVALPVLNKLDQLVGIVTHDEAMDVIRAEHSEDMQKFMGISTANEVFDYVGTGVWKHFKKRVLWIVALAILGLLSGVIVQQYETTLEKLLVLVLFMPMMASTGGNAGSQAATVVIRALSLGQVTVKSWFKILFKEARVSIMIGICVGVLAFGKVLFLSQESDIPELYSIYMVAFAISIAISLQVVTSTLIGAGLPLLFKRFGGDPAVAASPAITTIVDITGLLIYFSIASAFFNI
jgi:magnesium transporter